MKLTLTIDTGENRQSIDEALHVCREVLRESIEHHGKLSSLKAQHGMRLIDKAKEGRHDTETTKAD
jgi:hypothetical protein